LNHLADSRNHLKSLNFLTNRNEGVSTGVDPCRLVSMFDGEVPGHIDRAS